MNKCRKNRVKSIQITARCKRSKTFKKQDKLNVKKMHNVLERCALSLVTCREQIAVENTSLLLDGVFSTKTCVSYLNIYRSEGIQHVNSLRELEDSSLSSISLVISKSHIHRQCFVFL